jgi:hypothetical protein
LDEKRVGVPMTIYALARPGKYALEGSESAEGDGKSGVLAAWCEPAIEGAAVPRSLPKGLPVSVS